MNNTSEILWMLLTVLSVPIDKGMTYIGIEKDSENLFRFMNALEIYQYSWVEEFDFLYDTDKNQFSDIQKNFSSALTDLTE